jgi:dTDP-4-dehydrorhamnose 3,5-epimerase-like enzyme
LRPGFTVKLTKFIYFYAIYMSIFRLIDIPTFSDERGILSVLEGKSIPFNVARIYWIHGADRQTRGGHRHRVTQQALVAIKGEVVIYMNDGSHDELITLNHSTQSLIVEPEDWHTMSFGEGAVLLVLASHPYNLNDYIDAPYE